MTAPGSTPASSAGEPFPAPVGEGAADTLTATFLQACGHQLGAGSLVPAVLARAAVQVLPVDAGGLSTLTHGLRLPLGATTLAAEVAEELQTTLGEGPCLRAAEARTGCVADLAELQRSWPLYAEELTRRTPYRSAVSIPLSGPTGEIFAALDLYAEDSKLSDRLDVQQVTRDVGEPLGALLEVCLRPLRALDDGQQDDEQPLPEWYDDVTLRRHTVWVAIGMVRSQCHRPVHDALSALRGHAYSRDRSLDDVAADIVHRRMQVDDLDL